MFKRRNKQQERPTRPADLPPLPPPPPAWTDPGVDVKDGDISVLFKFWKKKSG